MQFKLLAVCALFFIVSCRSKKPVTFTTYDFNMSKSKVIDRYNANSFKDANIKTVKVNAKASYKIGDSAHKLGLKFRIAKGEKIWISGDFLGFPVMKILIEKDKISYYNKFNKTYFEGSFAFISQLLGVNVSYKVLENLFVGDLFLNIESKRFVRIKSEDGYYFTDLKVTDYITELLINHTNYKTKSQVIEHFSGKNLFAVYYNSYQNIGNFVFPKDFTIKGFNKNKETVIAIKYGEPNFDEQLSFPYKVPKECNKRITLKTKDNNKNINE